MDKLNSMTLFVEVVNNEGFTAAADKIGLSRAQVSKSIMQLETHLGTRLLNRTTRQISLTDFGKIYYERCQSILEEIDEVEGMASLQTLMPQGNLTISVPTSFGILHLSKVLPEYLKLNPQVQIAVTLTDRFVDVVAEGFDLAIRIAELKDSSLIARKIAPCKRVFCASPVYLQKHGTPKLPEDLKQHQCLVYSNELRPDNWTLHGANGSETVRIKGPVCADNGEILKDAALADMGITLLPTFIVGSALRDGTLIQVLQDHCPPEISIHAVFPSRRFLSAKVRTFVDFLGERFGDNPDWDTY